MSAEASGGGGGAAAVLLLLVGGAFVALTTLVDEAKKGASVKGDGLLRSSRNRASVLMRTRHQP